MNLAEGQAINDRVVEIAERCQLNIEHLRRFPPAFSGGQRQRISIARALITQPEFVVCDEAVSALDVSIRAEILNLLEQLRQDFQLTFLFIAHDLQVVQHICDRVAVMYVGQLIELGSTPQVFSNPLHPYTAALMSAIPEADPTKAMKLSVLKGEIPNPVNPPTGCRFYTRYQFTQDICRTTVPEWQEHAAGQFAACHFAEELDLSGPAAV